MMSTTSYGISRMIHTAKTKDVDGAVTIMTFWMTIVSEISVISNLIVFVLI